VVERTLTAALSRAEKLGPGRPEDVKEPVARLVEYNDGFRAVALALGGLVNEYLMALRVKGRRAIESTLCYVPPENSNNFSMLVHGIAQMFQTQIRPYPVRAHAAHHRRVVVADGVGVPRSRAAGDARVARGLHRAAAFLLCAPKGILMAAGLEGLLAPNAVPKKVVSGLGRAEGPVFSRRGYLLISDTVAGRILKWEAGETSTFRQNGNGAIGLTFDHQGQPLACERGRVTRTEKDGRTTVLAGRLGAPYDLVYAIDGSIYFSDAARAHSAVYQITRKGELRVGREIANCRREWRSRPNSKSCTPLTRAREKSASTTSPEMACFATVKFSHRRAPTA
jgi:hypothetical protein